MSNSLIPLIVTYNRLPYLKKLVNVWLQAPVKYIVIVNNNSTDGTKEYLDLVSKRNPKIIVLNSKKNLGGAGGFKKGMEFIHKKIKDYEWIVLQDDDAFPNLDSIEYFMQKNKNKYTAYISAVFNKYYKPCEMNRPGFNPFKDLKILFSTIIKGSRGFHVDDSIYYQEKSIKVDFASFVGFFIHKELITKVGFPRASFFIYADDLEYTLRITSKGFSIEFDPKIKFIHLNKTLLSRKKIYNPVWKAYFTYRNNIYIYKKLSGKMFPLVLSVKTLEWLLKSKYYKNRWEYIQLLRLALKDGLNLNFRKRNQEIIEMILKR